ncbi:MAG: SMP-30/gluconolactonase/LRE family protein [Gemmatimonadales bacterium]
MPFRIIPLLLLALTTGCGSAVRSASAPTTAVRPAAGDSTWRDHVAAAAQSAADPVRYRHHLERVHAELPGQPQVIWALARAEAMLQNPDSALAWLRRYADLGLTRDPTSDSVLAPLAARPAYAEIAARLVRNREPVDQGETAFTLHDAELVPEDVTYDPGRRRFLVSSVRKGKVIAVERDGRRRDFARVDHPGWSVLAVVADSARRRLWATASALPQAEGYSPGDSARTALLAFDLASGDLVRRLELPADGAAHSLGDIALGPDGTLVLSDARSGELWRLRPDGKALELLVPRDVLVSPQGIAFSPDGRRVLVADYARGIAQVDLATGAATWLPQPRNLAGMGIDGLVLAGRDLIAMQNGVRPPRVLRLRLDRDLGRIESWSVIEAGTETLSEPTHGVAVEGWVYYIANAGWDRLEEDGRVRNGAALQKGIIRRVLVEK